MLKEYCFHSHTYRCGHAAKNKDIEDYVTEAIQRGFKKYGVSDHVFLPGVIQEGIRGDYSLLQEYIDELPVLRNTLAHKASPDCGQCKSLLR